MNYNILNSGSDGNCLIIEDTIAIDMGVSYKKLSPYVKKLKIVLTSHIHGDHFNKSTIKRLAKERPTLRFGCCEWLVKDLVDLGVEKKNIDVFKLGKIYDYKDFKIIVDKLYHDVPNCCYKLKLGTNKIIYATDTNRIDHIIAKNYDYYFIEGNYYNEEELTKRKLEKLSKGEYYYEDRVKDTHLSKIQATEWLMENMGSNSKYIFMHEHRSDKNGNN